MISTKRAHPLQSRSEVLLRNLVVSALILFFTVFYLIPIVSAFVGSFHLWNPLKGQYKYTGLKNWENVFHSRLFWQSMKNTAFFCRDCRRGPCRSWTCSRIRPVF